MNTNFSVFVLTLLVIKPESTDPEADTDALGHLISFYFFVKNVCCILLFMEKLDRYATKICFYCMFACSLD